MAAALLGKCIGLFVLLVLFYSCCYAFRIRDGPQQPAASEQAQRSRCDPIFGRCSERTSAPTAAGQKWHEPPMHRLPTNRKPPVDVTSLEDHQTDSGGTASRREKLGYSKLAATARTARTKTADINLDDDDDDEAIVLVEGESDEELLEEQLEDSEASDNEDDDIGGPDDEDEDEDNDFGSSDEKNDNDEEDDDEGEDDGEGDEDEDDEDEEPLKSSFKRSAPERNWDSKKDIYSSSKTVKVVKSTKHSNEDDKEAHSVEVEPKTATSEKAVKKLVTRIVSSKTHGKLTETADDDEKDDAELKRTRNVEDDESKDAELDEEDNEEKMVVDHDESDEDEEADEDDEDEENDQDDQSEDDDEEESKEDQTTPPPRKLEKVRLADKDKPKPVNVLPTSPPVEKSIMETKEIPKARDDSNKKTLDTLKKPPEPAKKSAESIIKSGDATKKVEPTKIMKIELEESKSKSTVKSESKVQTPTKAEISKQAKVTAKGAIRKVDAESSSAKPVQVSGSDKKESKTKRSAHGSISLGELNDAILRVPTFVPNFTAIEDPECQQHGKIFLRQLRGYKLWALQMLDSSAKIPSGLLRGNVNQFGDFDQCLGVLAHVKVEERTIKVQGKYCLASIDLYASKPDMKLPVHLMQSRTFIRGSMRDPGHFIPKFTTVNWALCLPAACSAEDAENVLERALSDYNVTAGIKFSVDVDSNMCYVKQRSRTYTKETIGVLYFYAMIICLAVVATVRDYLVQSDGKGNYSERIIMSFSLRRTMKALLREGSSEADITCIHGIRALVTFALYIAHQLIPTSRLPFSNRISLTEVANYPISSLLRASWVYTDAFLLLSGVLTAYNMAKENAVRGEIRWFCRFIARYIRLTPALLVIVFWYAFVMEHIGSGPQWNSVVLANAELCKNNAWTNLLYIQNFFPFEETCATHTHQLALDMQLSLLAPMLVFFLHFKPLIGILLISFFVLLSATLRYIATAGNNLSIVIYHGMSLKNLYKTANLTYALPFHRATPYVCGVGLGVLLHYTGKNVKIHKLVVMLGWLVAMALGSWSLFSPWRLAKRDYVYDVEEATHYTVICPVAWALALGWFIFACFTNNGGLINRLLSNYWLVLLSRISYAVYLTQFAVFFYNVGTTRYSTEFQLHRAIDTGEAVIVLFASIVLTLLFDLPMQEVKNVIMESTDGLTSSYSTEEKPASGDEEKLETKTLEDDGVREDGEFARSGMDQQKNTVQSENKSIDEHVGDREGTRPPLLKKSSGGRRKSFVESELDESTAMSTYDWVKGPSAKLSRGDEEYMEKGRRGRSSQRDLSYDSEEEILEYTRIQQAREEAAKRNRRSASRGLDSKRGPSRQSEQDDQYSGRREERDDTRQYRRSESRGRSGTQDPEEYRGWEFVGKERPPSRNSESRITAVVSDEYETTLRQARTPVLRSGDVRRTVSSESEGESGQRKRFEKKHMPVESKISDEEEWESELRARRKQFMEKHPMEEKDSLEEEGSRDPRRRSSAEGKIALLRDPSGDDNMDSWTTSVDPRIVLQGSFQEPTEPEDDTVYRLRREYREQAPPPREDIQSDEETTWDSSRRRSYTSGSQVTSLEEDEDVSGYNFILTKESKRISLQDLSKLSQDEADLSNAGWNVVMQETTESLPLKTTTNLGLYKRESIVKSQASEEDPEYLLPERPKLVQQEREHPFKKAWQMQKSRSEEDGSAAYAIRESKEHLVEKKLKDDEDLSMEHQSSTEHSEDVEGSLADDESESNTLSQSRSSDTDGTKQSSRSDETESTSIEPSKIQSFDEKGNAIHDTEDDPSEFNWPTEDEQFESFKITLRRKSEETEWKWEQDET